MKLPYFTNTVVWAFDLVIRRGCRWWWKSSLFLQLGFQHGFLTLAAQINRLHCIKALTRQVGWTTASSSETYPILYCPLSQWTQVAAAVDWVACQVETSQFRGAKGQRLQDTQLVMAEVKMGELGGEQNCCTGKILQGVVIQKEVCKLGHRYYFLPEIGHGIVTQV